MNNNKKVTIRNNQISNKKSSVIDDLVDALFLDDFNEIMDNYTNSELDFQTIVLFIKLYMMAYRVIQNEDIDVRKQNIKDLIHYIMENPSIRSDIIKSFNDQTIIKTFFDQIKKLPF